MIAENLLVMVYCRMVQRVNVGAIQEIEKYRQAVSKGQKIANIDHSIKAAYGDLCRTIHGFSRHPRRAEIYREWFLIVKDFIDKVQAVKTKKDFDDLHKLYSDKLIAIDGILTYGQTQKWLNMALKDLFALEYEKNNSPVWLEYAHLPIDNYILVGLAKEYGEYPQLLTAWSRIIDYDRYMTLQEFWRSKTATDYTTLSPLEAEFVFWGKYREAV